MHLYIYVYIHLFFHPSFRNCVIHACTEFKKGLGKKSKARPTHNGKNQIAATVHHGQGSTIASARQDAVQLLSPAQDDIECH